jgi:hypothetical protein
MADLLERMAFACEVAIAVTPNTKAVGDDKSSRETLQPSFTRYAEEARALVSEYRGRAT